MSNIEKIITSNNKANVEVGIEAGEDPHSYARPEEVCITHLDLTLQVDFGTKKLQGSAVLSLENRKGVDQLILDTRGLLIKKVSLDPEDTLTTWRLLEYKPHLGSALVIVITPETKSVRIDYETTSDAEALQWLTPAMTAGGKKPFLFSQSQAILARTWVPCQDTPSVRFTYNAKVTVPKGLMALMSATNPTQKSPDGVYHFVMKQKIPSYLLALAVGDLEFAKLGTRCGVYAEPSQVKAAQWEFAETEAMMTAAESLFGPYAWERYDILVLPPSFPFGGMENPRLTFATPSVLVGDRSLVALIAHELSHSWSGNFVTNASWNDFWLNEGFTVYCEHRIMEVIKGRDYEAMLAVLDMGELKKELSDEIGWTSPDSHLHLNLKGRDPDAGVTTIAYNKGFFFLKMIEEAVGRPRWDSFLRGYFAHFAFQSITTAQFLSYLKEHLFKSDQHLFDSLQIEAWVYGPGIPTNAPKVSSHELELVESMLKKFLEDKLEPKDFDTTHWTTHHWLYFLQHLPRELSFEKLSELDEAFHLTATQNGKIAFEWLLLVIKNDYTPGYPALEDFLLHRGNRHYLKLLYTALNATSAGRKRAQEIYRQAREHYHPITVAAIDEVLSHSPKEKSL